MAMEQEAKATAPSLTSRKLQANELNKKKLDGIPGEMLSYTSVDWRPNSEKGPGGEYRLSTHPKDDVFHEPVRNDVMNGHVFSSVTCLETVHLKKGALVVSTKSISMGLGQNIPNGTFGMVVGTMKHETALLGLCGDLPSDSELEWWSKMGKKGLLVWPIVDFTIVTADGLEETVRVTVTPVMHDVLDCNNAVRLAGRLGLPLQCAWALTCHRAQGLTLPGVVINMGKPFAFGQVYTAVSRVRKFSDITFTGTVSNRWMLASPVVINFLRECEKEWIILDNSEEIVSQNAPN